MQSLGILTLTLTLPHKVFARLSWLSITSTIRAAPPAHVVGDLSSQSNMNDLLYRRPQQTPQPWQGAVLCPDPTRTLSLLRSQSLTSIHAEQKMPCAAGCCKTTLVRAAATASGAHVVSLAGASLFSMYVGEGEALLRSAFQRARQAAPSIVFLDELDALVGAASAPKHVASNEAHRALAGLHPKTATQLPEHSRTTFHSQNAAWSPGSVAVSQLHTQQSGATKTFTPYRKITSLPHFTSPGVALQTIHGLLA